MRRAPLPRAGVAAAVLALLTWAAPSPGAAQASSPDGLESYGEADYDWELETMERERLSFEAFRGEVVVLNAWATWCPPCVDEMDSFAALRDSVADTDVRFLFLTTEDREHVRRFLRLEDLDLPVVFERSRLPPAYGQFGLPTTWIIDRDGRIVLRHPGAARWNTPEVEVLLRHLAGDGGPG